MITAYIVLKCVFLGVMTVVFVASPRRFVQGLGVGHLPDEVAPPVWGFIQGQIREFWLAIAGLVAIMVGALLVGGPQMSLWIIGTFVLQDLAAFVKDMTGTERPAVAAVALRLGWTVFGLTTLAHALWTSGYAA